MITKIKYLCHIPWVMKKNKQTNEQKTKTSDLKNAETSRILQHSKGGWWYEVAGSGKMGGPDPVFLLLFY